MKEIIRYGFILALISTLASASLAVMNSVTKPRIISQAKAEEELSLKEVFPLGNSFEPIKSGEDIVYYKVLDKDAKFIGVVFKASGKGYSSIIETMAGMTQEGRITAIKILSQNETPGLGARVSEQSFAGQFSGKDARGLSEVSAITGATISSKAVIDSVMKKAGRIMELTKNAK